jgi:hypothetical protein
VGAWDTGPFDNDTAAGWSGEFDDASAEARIEMIEEALRGAADETDYLEVDVACEAIAAAAVVASLHPGGPPIDSAYAPDFITGGGRLDLPPALTGLAIRALDRVAEEDSEWRDLWDQAGTLEDAVADLVPIRAALTS